MSRRPERPVAVVTGANRGLGLEICRQLALRDHRVVLTGRDGGLVAEAVELLLGEGLEVDHHCVDVTAPDQVDELGAALRHRYGGADVLVNNGAIVPDAGEPFDLSTCSILVAELSTLRAGMETNAYGALLMAQALVPGMRERGWGRVVNVSSGMGAMHQMGLGWPGYRLSKVALNALTVILADECRGRGVLVNAMDPGRIQTRLGGDDAPRTAAQGADTVTWLATLPEDGPTSGFFFDRRPIPW